MKMPQARKRAPIVPPKMKIVIKELLENPKWDLEAAAKAGNVSTYWARRHLKEPHILKYLRDEKAAMLEEARAGNIPALTKVRAESENDMAIVNAVRQLETMGEVIEAAGAGATRFSPGLVVQIVTRAGEIAQTIGPPLPAPSLQIEHDDERVASEP
jgi:hypothetical protein